MRGGLSTRDDLRLSISPRGRTINRRASRRGAFKTYSEAPAWPKRGTQGDRRQCPGELGKDNGATPEGAIPANVSESARAIVTAGLANEVDAVNQ